MKQKYEVKNTSGSSFLPLGFISTAEGCKTTLDIASLAGFGTRCDAWGIDVLGCPCSDGTDGTVQGCKKFPRKGKQIQHLN